MPARLDSLRGRPPPPPIALAARDALRVLIEPPPASRLKTASRSGVPGQSVAPVSSANERLAPEPGAKAAALRSVMFHIAIENVSQRSYFSEKLLDCFLTRTVPVYWGCRANLGEYFDLGGVILVGEGAAAAPAADSEEAWLEARATELIAAVNALTPRDYAARQASIDDNFERAKAWTDLQLRMQRALDAARAEGASEGTSPVA